ncbi:MAG: murein biosynthesis integral membrane protein MurJ [Deltaproteobacteria bacterium]|nr:murein biosynthesis integral membrane protein MurJ [Deltaproteobacteria bacterium]
MEPIRSAEADAAARRERAEAAGVPAAAALLAGSVLLSRALGFVREALLAYQVGATGSADAYYAAFTLPDLLNHLLAAGALSIAFLPLYTQVRERGEAEAERLLATMIGTLGLVALAGTALLWLVAGPLTSLQYPAFDAAKHALTTRLTRIVLPGQVFFLVGGVVQAALLARGRFLAAALAPLVYNLGIVAGGLLLGPWLGVEGFAWGALAGAVLGPFGCPWLDARRRLRLGWRVAPRAPEFRRYLWLAIPVVAGFSLLTVDEWYGKWFAPASAGAIALLSFARRLMQAPVAVIGQAVAAAAQPALANLWAAGRGDELDRVLTATLRSAFALGVLAGAVTFALAEPLVAVVYERGAFDAKAAAETARLLAIFSATVPAWVLQQISVRAFYARSETWRPMLLGTAFVLAAIPLYLVLGRRHGIEGVAAAGVVAMWANALATLLYARVHYGGPALLPLAASAARAFAIAALAAPAAAFVIAGRSGTLGALADLALGGLVFAVVAALGVALLGDAALRDALRRLARRVPARRTPAPG